MSNTHTPGPWEVRNGCNVFANAAHAPLTNDGLIAITGSLSGRDTIDRDAANARLIAEAPAMLEALRKAERFLEGFEDAGDLLDDPIDDDLAEIRAILARIDGVADQVQAERPAAEPTAICCTACGSTSVGCDAYARWDGSDWELSSTFDDTICDACGYESSSGFEEVKQSELRAWREERGFDADALEKEGAQ